MSLKALHEGILKKSKLEVISNSWHKFILFLLKTNYTDDLRLSWAFQKIIFMNYLPQRNMSRARTRKLQGLFPSL